MAVPLQAQMWARERAFRMSGQISTSSIDRVRVEVRAVLHEYDMLADRLAAVDRAADFAGWGELHREHEAYIDGLVRLETTLGDLGEYELATSAAQRILDAYPNLRGYRERLAAYRTAVTVERLWCEAGMPATGRHSRQQIGGEWSAVRAFDRAPYWDGSPLRGRTLLLRHGLGYGDVLLRLRHVRPLTEQYGARVVVEVEAPLGRLARTTPFVSDVVERRHPECRIPGRVEYAAWVSTLDLPVVMGIGPRDHADVPYLVADPGLIARWGWRLGKPDGRLRVGLVWSADASHEWGRERSMRLAQFAPLATVPGVRWFSIQKTGSIRRAWTRPEDGGPEAEPAPAGMDLTRLGPELGDFADTAAVLHNLDLLVTVDTSVANLAGGLGLPFWVMLPTPKAPAAVWGTRGESCAAYPTAQRFRQDRPGEWAPVVQRVADALRNLVAERGADR